MNSKKVSECVILCTCNRTELYFCGNKDSVSVAENLLSDYSGIECDLLRKHLCLFYSDKAVLHLFRVVSGIESMVNGEDEILGQVRLAYNKAKDAGMIGYELNMTFQSAMACAKKIKTQTAEILWQYRDYIKKNTADEEVRKKVFSALMNMCICGQNVNKDTVDKIIKEKS